MHLPLASGSTGSLMWVTTGRCSEVGTAPIGEILTGPERWGVQRSRV